MKVLNYAFLFIFILISTEISAQKQETATCTRRGSPCFLMRITCPKQCPSRRPGNAKAKACFVNCDSPICKAECRNRRPSCNGIGAACYDPRFIGADGVVFYFHGKNSEHFALVTDHNLQINARFIGHRPAGRARDYTWIQGLGILFGTHNFSVEATKAVTWDTEKDHLKFSFDSSEIVLPEIGLSSWKSTRGEVMVERILSRNSVIVSITGVAEIGVNAVPITEEDDRIHNYQIPADDCFAHLEVQLKFFDLSSEVEGVLGRTYQLDYESPAKLGAAMAVAGGEDKYRTTSLFAADCKKCLFSSAKNGYKKPFLELSDNGFMKSSAK